MSEYLDYNVLESICSQPDLKQLKDKKQVIRFLGMIIDQTSRIKIRNQSRGRFVWKSLSDIKLDDEDDLDWPLQIEDESEDDGQEAMF